MNPETSSYPLSSLIEKIPAIVRKNFGEVLVKAGVCIGILLAIHMFPKPQTGDSSVRLYLTIGYFATCLALLVNLLKPRQQSVLALFSEKYADFPPQVQQLSKRYAMSINSLADSLVYILIALVTILAFKVLGNSSRPWIDSFQSIAEWMTIPYYLTVTLLLLFPFFRATALSEVSQFSRQLREQAQIFEFSGEQAGNRAPLQEGKSLKITGSDRFECGQAQWNFELLSRNVFVFGETGSGKTVCVLNTLLEGVMGASSQSPSTACAGLILDPKGDYQGKLGRLCNKYRRGHDLIVIDPFDKDHGIRWNPLDSDDDDLELAERFAAIIDAKNSEHGKGEAFWVDSAKKFIAHGISLIRLTNPEGEPPNFVQLAALSSSLKAIAERTDLLDVSDSACELCLEFFANEWLELASETRTSIQAYVSNMLDPFQRSPYREVFSGKSDFRIPDMIDQGKLLYVNMPIADKEAMSVVVCSFAKMEYFREVLKRPDKVRPSLFFCDEFQVYFTHLKGKGDSDFFERSRQSNHINIVASQNLQALFKQAPRKESAKNLLGNCASKIFLRNTEEETNEWSSKLFGEHIVSSVSTSSSSGSKGRFKGNSLDIGSTDQYDRVVRPERFATLATPSRTHGVTEAESVIHISSSSDGVNPRFDYHWAVHPID